MSESGPVATEVAAPRRKDASMSLLVDVMTRTVDPSYAEAARQRAERGDDSGRGTRGRTALAVVAMVALGVLLSTAWLQARGTRPAGVLAREQLAAEIARQDASAGALQRSNAKLLGQIEAERRRQLELGAASSLADQVADLAMVTGASAVRGPGVTVTLDDASSANSAGGDGDPRSQQSSDDGRVLDQDLQLVVNGLWDAGAEAIAINGQRLTALSAIRSAGEAILVDYRPLSPPYTISAIGSPDTLQTRFSDGPGGRDVQYLKDNFGVQASIAASKNLLLPASAGLDTRRAKALSPSPKVSTSPTSTSPTSGKSRATPTRPQETP
ncbi:DUF881 domain-containing protein [Angustibacter sp. McL0619]|uniref:DUF881 domain-containing protein n=1 Tax=Angustibacter sp. McL0619 TaxID=3415676 RepID=UPI003CFAF0A0